MTVGSEPVCAKWMWVIEPLTCTLMNLTQVLPSDAGPYESIDRADLQKIKKSKSYCVINRFKLTTPDRR